jgi:hypothetical protein
LGTEYLVVLCAGSALLLAKDKSTSIVNGALVGVLLSQSASPSVIFLTSPRSTYLGILTEGKLADILIIPSSWGSQQAGYPPHTRTVYSHVNYMPAASFLAPSTGSNYDDTYSPEMSGITFRYLISLAVQMNLSMQLMDIVTAYLYGSLDADIYMKVPDGLKILNPDINRNMYCVKLQKSLYGLK